MNQVLSNPEIVTGEQAIESVAHKGFLGAIVDQQLDWHKQIDRQCKKISKNIALLSKKLYNNRCTGYHVQGFSTALL